MDNQFCIQLPRPHPQQARFLHSRAKRKIICAGRRSGKTTGAGTLAIQRFLAGDRVLYAAPTADQLGTFWHVVSTALASLIDAGVFTKSEIEHTMERPFTRQRLKARTAWNADALRGDYADLLILDEYQIMDESVWAEVGAPMLLDNDGDAVFLYTPPSLHSRSASKATDPRHASNLYKMAAADESGRWACFRFTSHDNPHISKDALNEITRDMTHRAYRQEIEAEDTDDILGALWNREMIDACRVSTYPPLIAVVVAVDPSLTSGAESDEAGIVVGGVGEDGDGYVVADLSGRNSPKGWATVALTAYRAWKADRIVGETNNGGEMVEFTLRTIDPSVPYKPVNATRGKLTRAEPICAL